MSELRDFKIKASLRFSGRSEISMTIRAADEKEAEAKFDDLDLTDHCDTWNMDVEVDGFEIHCDERLEPIQPRCRDTLELF